MRFKIPKQQPASFRASSLYLAGLTKGQSPDRVAWMEARNLHTEDPRAAAAVMDATAARSTRCRNPAYHFVLAFDPKDVKAGRLTPELMREIAAEAVERLELSEYQALIYAHKDTEHPHLHFLVNRVHPGTGKAYSRHNDGRRITALCREIARERGLNIPLERARIPEREHVDDFDDIGQLPTNAEYWQAKREGRAPQAELSKERVRFLRDQVKGHFHNAKDWSDLAARLAARGVALERKGQGLILSREDGYAKLSAMGKGIRFAELEKRFGERFDAWMARQTKELVKAEARGEQLPDFADMSPAERRRAERLFKAKQEVQRKRDDPVLELDNADVDYQYWRGVQAAHRYSVHRLKRAERDRLYQGQQIARRETWVRRTEDNLMDGMSTVYRNADKAHERWGQLEKELGIDDAAALVKAKPELLGKLRGGDVFGARTAERKEAEKAVRYLKHRRQKWRFARQDLEHTRHLVQEARNSLERSLSDYEAVQRRFGTPLELHQIMRRKVRRRSKALERTTEKAIRSSSFLKERKEELARAWRIHVKKQRERERGREVERLLERDREDF